MYKLKNKDKLKTRFYRFIVCTWNYILYIPILDPRWLERLTKITKSS